MSNLQPYALLTASREYINSFFAEKDACSIILYTLLTGTCIYFTKQTVSAISKYGIVNSIQLALITVVKKLPGGNKIIASELEKTKQDLLKVLNSSFPKSLHQKYYKLPDKGVDRKLIREELLYHLSQEKEIRNKRAHGGIYYKNILNEKYLKYLPNDENKSAENEVIDIIDKNFTIKDEAYLYFSHSNTLYPFLFPGIRKFDVELVAMCSKMLHAKETAGNLASGGTESIFLAMVCWRKYAKSTKGITKPNIVIPITAHPSFCKAAHYLSIEVKFAPVIRDMNSNKYGTVNIDEMKKLIDANTICLVGSAPCFPYSAVDDIESICALAKRKKGSIPVHVDNCLGGFLLTFLYDSNKIDKPFDFRVNGVLSISCDIHKHAGSHKGCSAILYNESKYRSYQYYSYVNWPGGLYTLPTFQGASNGGLKAVAWSMLLSKGKNTLMNNAVKLYEKTNYLKEQIEVQLNDCCDVLGSPIACGVAFKFKNKLQDLDYAIAEAVHEVGGWEITRLQFPSALMFQTGQSLIDEMDQFVVDLKKSIDVCLKNVSKYKKSGMASVYGTAATFPDRSLVAATCSVYLDVIHSEY